jgi:hypothetical protein
VTRCDGVSGQAAAETTPTTAVAAMATVAETLVGGGD